MIKQLAKSYEEKVSVCTYEVDFTRNLKLSALLNRMQETTAKHCDGTPFARDFLLSHGIFWALARMKIQVREMPRLDDEITIKTWPKSRDKMFAYREFLISRDGSPLVLVTSDWILMDISTRKTCRIAKFEEIGVVFPEEQEGALQERPGKIITEGDPVRKFTRVISYNDIDMYGHVNNVRYLEWAFDTFSALEMERRRVSDLQINFTAEAKDTETIEVTRYQTGEGRFMIEGNNRTTGAKAFQVIMEMQDV